MQFKRMHEKVLNGAPPEHKERLNSVVLLKCSAIAVVGRPSTRPCKYVLLCGQARTWIRGHVSIMHGHCVWGKGYLVCSTSKARSQKRLACNTDSAHAWVHGAMERVHYMDTQSNAHMSPRQRTPALSDLISQLASEALCVTCYLRNAGQRAASAWSPAAQIICKIICCRWGRRKKYYAARGTQGTPSVILHVKSNAQCHRPLGWGEGVCKWASIRAGSNDHGRCLIGADCSDCRSWQGASAALRSRSTIHACGSACTTGKAFKHKNSYELPNACMCRFSCRPLTYARLPKRCSLTGVGAATTPPSPPKGWIICTVPTLTLCCSDISVTQPNQVSTRQGYIHIEGPGCETTSTRSAG
jgi:hypothetical protein